MVTLYYVSLIQQGTSQLYKLIHPDGKKWNDSVITTQSILLPVSAKSEPIKNDFISRKRLNNSKLYCKNLFL